MNIFRNNCIRITAVCFITLGIVLIFLRIYIFDAIISSIFVITPNSKVVDAWTKAPVEINTDFYLFNWTNPEEIHNLTSKPKFKELGPYSFKRVTEKVNITWNANDTVTYRLLQSYYFDETKSKGKLTDLVTTLNTVTLIAAHKMRHDGYFKRRGFSFSLNLLAPTIHVTKPASELLFDGYQDPYIDLAQILPPLDDSPPAPDRVGFLYNRNNSYMLDGTYNIANGIHGNIGEILSWNYRSQLRQYDDDCAELGGSNGEFYPSKRNRTYAKMFAPDTCSNLKLDYEKDVLVKGINGYKYSAQQSLLDNGTIIPRNKCFCSGDCIPSGMINITSCKNGAPMFASLPHYYAADPVYLDKIEGLSPDKSKHEMYLVLEPRIGVCLDIAVRIQINSLLHPVKHITLYENVPTVYFPVLWFEQRFSFPDNSALRIKILLSVPSIIIPIISTSLVVLGTVLFIFKTNFHILKLRLENNRKANSRKISLPCDKITAKNEEVLMLTSK